jgi:hypothetical protein
MKTQGNMSSANKNYSTKKNSDKNAQQN